MAAPHVLEAAGGCALRSHLAFSRTDRSVPDKRAVTDGWPPPDSLYGPPRDLCPSGEVGREGGFAEIASNSAAHTISAPLFFAPPFHLLPLFR